MIAAEPMKTAIETSVVETAEITTATSSSSILQTDPSSLTDIYQADNNIAIWQRQLDSSIAAYAQHIMSVLPHWSAVFIDQPNRIAQKLQAELPLNDHRQAFIDDIVLMADMFSCLFELDDVGLRIAVLDKAMCPKFHVDRIPCRLICTYAGAGTQWIPKADIECSEAGAVKLLPDVTPQHLSVGDVALLKGETWQGNEGNGLVHRSPPATQDTPRLVLTLDFVA